MNTIINIFKFQIHTIHELSKLKLWYDGLRIFCASRRNHWLDQSIVKGTVKLLFLD
jgi:hypothetical protein